MLPVYRALTFARSMLQANDVTLAMNHALRKPNATFASRGFEPLGKTTVKSKL